ncbi:hypothetical protein, partial [Streptomyces scabiei]|uniref:hypothetical protein n=1 Tax=Streptomyces scabiei TaxID=1930 RepID=UPI0029B7038C
MTVRRSRRVTGSAAGRSGGRGGSEAQGTGAVDGEVRDVKAVQAQTKDRLEVLYDKFLEFVGRT